MTKKTLPKFIKKADVVQSPPDDKPKIKIIRRQPILAVEEEQAANVAEAAEAAEPEPQQPEAEAQQEQSPPHQSRVSIVPRGYTYQHLKTRLYPHQRQFLVKAKRWERQGHGGLLGAEMGTGKTLMLLSLFAENLDQNSNPRRTIIVAPLSLIHNWRREYQKHLSLPVSKVAIYHGKKRYLTPLHDRFLVITTYETVRQDMTRWGSESPLYRFCAERLVLDEAHEIKNSDSQRFQALLELPARLRWAVTGTPIHNYRQDLESIAQFIGYYPYADPEWWETHQSKGDMEEWKENSYIYFSKSQINLRLPEKHLHHHILTFSEDEDKTYHNMKTEAKELFEEYLDGGSIFRFSVLLTKILRLRQFCNHPYAPLPTEQQENVPDPEKESTKTLKIVELLSQIPQGEKVLIFSQFKNTLDLIQKSLDRNGHQDTHLCYHGGLSPQQKEDLLRQFDQDDSKRIMLMSIKAGGVGLNLVRANHVILVDPWWNRPVEEQALARVHRIGQTKEVHIHRLSVQNSIEQWVISLQEHKLHQANQILDKPASPNSPNQRRNFTREDLRKLFKESCF